MQESHSEEGIWVSSGRLSILCGEDEAQEMIMNEELPTKMGEHGRQLWLYTEEKIAQKARGNVLN